MADVDKARENRARRRAAHQDLRIEKSPVRDPYAPGYGLWRIIDRRRRGRRPAGGYRHTLDEIEAFLMTPPDQRDKGMVI